MATGRIGEFDFMYVRWIPRFQGYKILGNAIEINWIIPREADVEQVVKGTIGGN